MKKVLVVAYYFPPISTSGAMRPLAFCRHLPTFGWSPRVVSTEPSSVQPLLPVDEELCARLPPGVRVDRVPHPNPLTELVRVRDRMRTRVFGTSGTVGRTWGPAPAVRTSTLSAFKRLALEHLFLFPDAQRCWLRPAVRRAASGERPDLVYATGGPWTALLAGRALARRFAAPFVADFRDPWTRNPFRDYSPSAWRRARRLERSVCRAASRVVVNTAELCDQFIADYPDIREKFVTLPNGFDSTSVAPTRPLGVDWSAAVQDWAPLEFWHFGEIYGKRSPIALLRAIHRLLDNRTLVPGLLRVRFVGAWNIADEACNHLVERLEGMGVIKREPPVPHQTCLDLMQKAQALLILQPASPLQVPGKIYEYISTGRPLVVIGGEGATASLVQRHHLGHCCPNDVEAIQSLLADVMDGRRLAPPQVTDVQRFNYRYLTGHLADVFHEAIGDGALTLAHAAL